MVSKTNVRYTTERDELLDMSMSVVDNLFVNNWYCSPYMSLFLHSKRMKPCGIVMKNQPDNSIFKLSVLLTIPKIWVDKTDMIMTPVEHVRKTTKLYQKVYFHTLDLYISETLKMDIFIST